MMMGYLHMVGSEEMGITPDFAKAEQVGSTERRGGGERGRERNVVCRYTRGRAFLVTKEGRHLYVEFVYPHSRTAVLPVFFNTRPAPPMMPPVYISKVRWRARTFTTFATSGSHHINMDQPPHVTLSRFLPFVFGHHPVANNFTTTPLSLPIVHASFVPPTFYSFPKTNKHPRPPPRSRPTAERSSCGRR